MNEPPPPGEQLPSRVDPPKPAQAARLKTGLAPVGAVLLLVKEQHAASTAPPVYASSVRQVNCAAQKLLR